jgi:hypothetical protein
MELASTAAAVAETAEKVYEGTQEIRKVCNATTEVKNVADSEGKDQLDATLGMAYSREMSSTTASPPERGVASSDIRSDQVEPGFPDKSMSDSTPLGTASDNPLKGATVFDEGIPVGAASQNPLKGATVFDEGIPIGSGLENPLKNATVFDESIPNGSCLETPLKDATVLKVETSLGNNTESPLRSSGESISEASKTTEPRRVATINDGLAGTTHPVTGVPFEEKVVETDTGEKVVGVFPEFESAFDVQLPKDLELATDKKQFDECNRQLKEKCKSDSEFRSKFTPDQLEDIEDGYTPEGYTWHHNEEKGKMQLVDTDTHWNTRHTGGRKIWGGGKDNRR